MDNRNHSGIIILGTAVILISLGFLNILVLKPNRIMRGTPITAPELWGGSFVFLCLFWALMVLWSMKPGFDRYEMGGWMTLAGILITSGLCAVSAGGLVPDGDTVARVSLGAGFWGSLFGGYICLKGWEYRSITPIRKLPVLLLPAGILVQFLAGQFDGTSLMREYFNRQDTFSEEMIRHLLLAFGSVITGGIIGIGWGIWIDSNRSAEKPSFFLINLAQTVPTLSLLGLLMIPLGYLGSHSPFLNALGIRAVGWAPAFIALTLYALLPVAANTVSGLRMVDQEILESAKGMGMKPSELFLQVKLPLALPVILSGFRTALTQAMGNTILAGLIGGGGMGAMIFLGLAQSAPDLVLLGTLPVVGLALAADTVMEGVVRWMTRREGGMTYDHTRQAQQSV